MFFSNNLKILLSYQKFIFYVVFYSKISDNTNAKAIREFYMEIKKLQDGNKLDMIIEGRLDTITAPALEASIKESITGVEKLTLDFEKLEYLSSAGLRVLLSTQKIMNKQGEMVIRNVNETIAEIFDITGFCDILNIE